MVMKHELWKEIEDEAWVKTLEQFFFPIRQVVGVKVWGQIEPVGTQVRNQILDQSYET